MEIKQVALVDVQPDKQTNEAIVNLIQYKPVSDNNIGLERLYELVDCKSKLIEKLWLGDLRDNNELHLIVDEEGTFGQWSRGIFIKNQDGYENQILGNCVFVKATPDGDWIGWDNETEMADDIRKYSSSIKLFDVDESKKTV